MKDKRQKTIKPYVYIKGNNGQMYITTQDPILGLTIVSTTTFTREKLYPLIAQEMEVI